MAEALGAIGAISYMIEAVDEAYKLSGAVARAPIKTVETLYFFTSRYGPSGIFIWIFGSREVWQMQMQVLGSLDDADAINFKKSIQQESSIIAVAATILAQIAITALSLENLSRMHWTARAFFISSLVSSIIAVYYATKQYRVLGRCLYAEQVKAWIQNQKKKKKTEWALSNPTKVASVASVITVSAPNMLLSFSLNSFLVGLGIYLGFTWTQSLDETAGDNGSRAVFITYIVGLCVCYGTYALSSTVAADQSYISEREWLRRYIATDLHSRLQALAVANEAASTRTPPDPDVERGTPLNAIPETLSGEARHGDILHEDTRKELLVLFQEAADMRKASAKVDERLARLLERLGEETGA